MCSRNIEEIAGILSSAKLSVDELLPLSQEITFDEQLSGTDLRLLELDKEIGDSIQVGDRLVIRGEDNDSAVLCTKTSSYELKNVETSNSLLIFNQLSFPEDVHKLDDLLKDPGAGCGVGGAGGARGGADGMEVENEGNEEIDGSTPTTPMSMTTVVPQFKNSAGRNQFIGKRSILHVAHTYLELTKIKPNLSRIQRILEPSSYNGPIEEDSQNHTNEEFYTFRRLLDQIPGSEEEIRDFMSRNLRTIQIDGNIRLVGDEYLFSTLSQVLQCIDSLSLKTKDIKKDVIFQELEGLHPDFILESIFHWFFVLQTDSDKPGPSHVAGLYSINDYEISRFLGAIILKTGGKFILSEFLRAWGESVPEGLKVNLKQLEGIAITDSETSSSPLIWYFAESKLPETIPERFQALFGAKPKWKTEEILPYLENVSVSSQAASVLLTKHARVYNVGGIKHCCSKHGK